MADRVIAEGPAPGRAASGRAATDRAASGLPGPGLDLAEKGRARTGETIALDRRLYMQLLAWTGCREPGRIARLLSDRGVQGVLYEDLNDPLGIGLLTFDEKPDYFLDTVRPIATGSPFEALAPVPSYTMFGRTYSMGWEPDLEEALITRPRSRLCSPELPWAVWYPLRRTGAFEELEEKEQRAILSEHGAVGRTFGKAGAAQDIRLACHGLSRDDNDFVIGLLGADLHPLSAVVQRMRKTRQTSRFIARLGPFFIGRVLWRSPLS